MNHYPSGGYPDDFRADLCSSEQPDMSVDAECAWAAREKIERLKMELQEAIKANEHLPGISESYSALRDECAPYDEDAFEADVAYAERERNEV